MVKVENEGKKVVKGVNDVGQKAVKEVKVVNVGKKWSKW